MLTARRENRLRTSRYLVAVPRKLDYALYHSILGQLCIVDDVTVELLSRFSVPGRPQDALFSRDPICADNDSFCRFFESRRFLVPADLDESQILDERRQRREADMISGRQVRVLQLVLANRCNFRCQYCFEGLGATPLSETMYANSTPERLAAQSAPANAFMSPEQAQLYMEQAIRMVLTSGNRELAVQFFGGEPLMSWKTIRRVLDHFGNGQRHGIALGYSLVTNGSLVTEEMARLFAERQVTVIVSYDSPESDARPLVGARNSHEIIRRALDWLQIHGARVVLNSMLGLATFDSLGRGLVDFAFAHGIYEIGVVLDFAPAFYQRYSALQIADKLCDIWRYARSKGVIVTGYWHQIFQGIMANDRYGQIGIQNCSAMGAQFSIEPSGDVFSCKASGGYFGNIVKVENILRNDTYRSYARRACHSPEVCRSCWLEHFCSGLCLGVVENRHNGDIYAVEESACDVYREVAYRLVNNVDADVPSFYLESLRKEVCGEKARPACPRPKANRRPTGVRSRNRLNGIV
jgi:uncharacterized protein